MDAARKEVVDEVFRITGKIVSDTDPVVTAALFFSHKVYESGVAAAGQISDAAVKASTVVIAAEAACRTMRAEHTQLIDAIVKDRQAQAAENKAERSRLAAELEGRLQRSLKSASRVHPSGEGPPTGWRGVLAGIAFGILLTGGVTLIACNFNRSLFSDARFGAEWKRVIPTLPPGLRDKLIEHFEKQHR
jgi:hypothetical protein